MHLTEASVPRVGGLKRWGHGDFCFFFSEKNWIADLQRFGIFFSENPPFLLGNCDWKAFFFNGTDTENTKEIHPNYLSPQTLAVSCQAWVVASSAHKPMCQIEENR